MIPMVDASSVSSTVIEEVAFIALTVFIRVSILMLMLTEGLVALKAVKSLVF